MREKALTITVVALLMLPMTAGLMMAGISHQVEIPRILLHVCGGALIAGAILAAWVSLPLLIEEIRGRGPVKDTEEKRCPEQQ